MTVWQPALPVQTTTATTTTAFRVKNKPLGPAGSENEIPTHVLPPCANLQVRAGFELPVGAHFWRDTDSFSEMHLGIDHKCKKYILTMINGDWQVPQSGEEDGLWN